MKYRCPKCHEIISDRTLRGVKGQHKKIGKKNVLSYFQACPKCGQESYHYNSEGETDEGSWIKLTDSGKDYDFMTEPVPYHCFVPTTLAECNNTCCLGCTYDIAKGGIDRSECHYRQLLVAGKKNPGLEAYGVV